MYDDDDDDKERTKQYQLGHNFAMIMVVTFLASRLHHNFTRGKLKPVVEPDSILLGCQHSDSYM